MKFRVHSTRHGGASGVWHFASGPSGRFNLEAPDGTCCLADTPQAAVYELLGPELQDMNGVGIGLAGGLMVTPVTVPAEARVANFDHEDAVHFGVVNELSASAYESYEISCRWAAAVAKAGFAGIRYISRMVSGSNRASWAIFGPAGSAPHRPFRADEARSATEVLREMGIPLLGDELAADLTVEEPPHWS